MIIMLVVTIIVFFILQVFVGTWIALLLAILLLISWGLFNYRAGTIGLINSNLRAYFKKNPKTWKKSQKQEDPDFEGAPINLY